MNFLGNAYLWVKAAHVVFVIFWMAGMFALPRYLVYHQEALVSFQEGRARPRRRNGSSARPSCAT